MLVLLLSPWAPLSAFCCLLAGICSGTYQPTDVSRRARQPGRPHAQASAWAILWLGVGGSTRRCWPAVRADADRARADLTRPAARA